jgi:hypothetical protein
MYTSYYPLYYVHVKNSQSDSREPNACRKMYDDVTLMKVPVFEASNIIEWVGIHIHVVVVHIKYKTHTIHYPLKSVRVHQRVHERVHESRITHRQVNSIVHRETPDTPKT